MVFYCEGRKKSLGIKGLKTWAGGGYGTSNSLKNSWLVSRYPRHYPPAFYLKYKADARSVEFAVNPK